MCRDSTSSLLLEPLHWDMLFTAVYREEVCRGVCVNMCVCVCEVMVGDLEHRFLDDAQEAFLYHGVQAFEPG